MPTLITYKGEPVWINTDLSTEVSRSVTMKVFAPVAPKDPPKIGKLQEMANILAAEFDIEPPNVRIGDRRKRGACYFVWLRQIYIPFEGTWRGTEHSMIHEFAHHLHQMTHVSIDSRGNRNRLRPHGREYMEHLRAVVLAWFGNLDAYNWQTEYKTIRAWHDRRKK